MNIFVRLIVAAFMRCIMRPFYEFGVGIVVGVPVSGNLAVNPTPKQLGVIQDVSFEITQDLKELRGQNKFPEDIAPGNMKGSGKAMFGRLDIDTFNQLFFAEQTTATGVKVIQANEPHAIPGSISFTIQVTNFATFVDDLSVFYTTTGKRFTKVSGAPAVGQYQVNTGTGTYTFAAGDANATVQISYTWNNSAVGETIQVLNHQMGYGPVMELWLAQPYQGSNGIHLWSVRFAKLGAPLKREDYQIAEMDFQFFANPGGLVIDFFQASS